MEEYEILQYERSDLVAVCIWSCYCNTLNWSSETCAYSVIISGTLMTTNCDGDEFSFKQRVDVQEYNDVFVETTKMACEEHRKFELYRLKFYELDSSVKRLVIFANTEVLREFRFRSYMVHCDAIQLKERGELADVF